MEKFEFLGTLGQGAYGKVWKCRCKRSGRLVAVKASKDRGEATQRDNINRELLPLLVNKLFLHLVFVPSTTAHNSIAL